MECYSNQPQEPLIYLKTRPSYFQTMLWGEQVLPEKVKIDNIQFTPKSKWKGIQTVQNSDVRGFGTTPQLSEIQTDFPTIIQLLNDIIRGVRT